VELKKVTEGESELFVPDVARPEQGEVFYNPSQALSRDFSILIYRSVGRDVLDGMAAAGARAVRLAHYGLDVTANDRSGVALELVRRNAELNGVELQVTHHGFQELVHSRKFGVVDVDPFGSPAPFVHCALHSAVHLLGVASTDTSALSGTYPRVSRRRYQFSSRLLPNHPEVGVRALAGFVAREAAKLEVAARPVFAHTFQHYHRLYFSLKRGARAADRLLGELGDYRGVGPIYMGGLWDTKLVTKMTGFVEDTELAHPQSAHHLDLIRGEAKFTQPYHEVHALCRELGRSCPPMDWLLKETGGVRTHFSPTGIRCKLDREEFMELLKTWKKP
jgi:tRNA (guanine26-N2/guanine27-N2)-dimethyltransferase